jgi:lipid II:glycine glycyltransferase (peptidoglycan interpeptide bridge formation enzyme)
MLITERKFGIFKIFNVFFVEEPVTINIPDWDIVTYHTYKKWGETSEFERQQSFTTIIDLRQDIDVIWKKIKRMHKRHIRRADKNGIKVTVSDNYERFHQEYKIFLSQKNNVDLFGLRIVSSQFMQKHGVLFLAEKQGEFLGGNLYYHDQDTAILSSIAYQKLGDSIDKNKCIYDANCFLHWEAMQYFKNQGFINYDFGGLKSGEMYISHQMDGLDFFKRSFGGDVILHYQYRKYNSRFIKLLFRSYNFLQTRI